MYHIITALLNSFKNHRMLPTSPHSPTAFLLRWCAASSDKWDIFAEKTHCVATVVEINTFLSLIILMRRVISANFFFFFFFFKKKLLLLQLCLFSAGTTANTEFFTQFLLSLIACLTVCLFTAWSSSTFCLLDLLSLSINLSCHSSL